MDYQTLVADKSTPGSIASWVNYATIQTSAPTIIEEAESFIYRKLRHFRMLTPPVAITISEGVDTYPLPDDLLEPSTLYLTGQFYGRLAQVTEDQVIGSWSYNGNNQRTQATPSIYYFNQTYLQFDTVMDRDYAASLTYFQQPAPLSLGNSTNFLTATYPRLMRCACMAGAVEWLKEAGQGQFDRTYWDQLAMAELDKAQAESDRAQRALEVGAIMVGGGGPGQSIYGTW